MSDNCNNCANNLGIYDMKCLNCRHRLLMSEPCKIMRKQIADNIIKYGEVPEWRIEPNCGCNNQCQRILNKRNYAS